LSTVKILLNGDCCEADRGETVESFLLRLGVDPRRVAVERNLELLPKAQYAQTHLAEGDRIEVVHFVGGG